MKQQPGHVDRSPPVPLGDAGAVVEQHPRPLLVTALGRQVERRVSLLVPVSHPAALLQHSSNSLGLAVAGRQVEYCPAAAVPHPRPGPGPVQRDQGERARQAAARHLSPKRERRSRLPAQKFS